MDFIKLTKGIVGDGNVFINEKLDRHTTFRVGGPAACFAVPESAEQTVGLIHELRRYAIPYYVIGNGSNLLISDEGFDGVIVKIGRSMSNVSIKDNIITAESGILLSALGAYAARRSLTGLEFAAGIPGTLGGGCVMNAGAYGGELKDVLINVKAITPDGDIAVYEPAEMEMGYRTSRFLDKDYVILQADIQLSQGNKSEIEARMDEFSRLRRDKQPLEFPNAGSTFKRPKGYFAGQLIEEAGLKGKGVGDACVSEKHAGFIVNKGSASARDIYDTILMVIAKVEAYSGIILEPEVRIIGKFA
ncbi:MAG: UDP-N-acetylmuramate dehydrogenase [Butyrivibrio sp.]